MQARRSPSPDEPVSSLRRIPIEECGEPLVELTEAAPNVYWVPRHPVFEYRRARLARRGVAERLQAAARMLPGGLLLAVVEGWRAPVIQQRMHEATRRRLREEHPDWTDRQVTRTANRFSAPMDRRAPPPHTTGGAVDVHLVDEGGQMLDFCSPYELMDPRQAPARARGLSAEAETNRAELRRVMEAAGFTNYPSEWWHWSYGDQGWAYRGGYARAFYGAVEPDEPWVEDGAEFRVSRAG